MSAGRLVFMMKLKKDATTEYRFLFVAGLLSLVRERRNPSTSSAVMLARSRLPNWNAKRESTNSQVLTVFFFRVCPVVLQMKIDCLGNCHGAPPVVGVVGGNAMKLVYTLEGVADRRGGYTHG